MSVRIEKYVRFALSLAGVGLLMLGTTQPVLATFIVTQNFDSAPATWVGTNNSSGAQAFGWDDQNRAGGTLGAGAGDVGGVFSRESLARYDTDVGSLDPSSNSLSLSGRGRFWWVASGSQDGNTILGWYDTTTSLNWVPDNYIAIRTDQNDAYVEYCANNGTLHNAQLAANLGNQNSWTIALNYDPTGNAGGGTITASINGGTPGVINLAAGDKDLMTNLNRFGLLTLANGGSNTMKAYYDDLSYTSAAVAPEPGTLALLVSGLIGLLCYAWRRRR